MPKLSDDTLLQCAIEPACQDRASFADACAEDSQVVANTLQEIKAMCALKGKRLADLTPEEDEAARLAFIYAAQWEESFVESRPDARYRTKSARYAAMFRATRLRRWGRTQLEANLAESAPVSIFDLLSGKAGL